MSTQPNPTPTAQAAPQPQPPAQQGRALSDILDAAIANTDQQQRESWANIQAVATVAAGSGAIQDLKTVTEASMRLLAGRALQINDFAALNDIKFIKGNITMRYTLIGTLIRRAGYAWGFIQHDENGCTLGWFRRTPDGSLTSLIDPQTNKQVITSWMRKHAEAADLFGPRKEGKEKGMYEKYPLSMYLAGCIRNFPRFHAPEITNGIAVYTPDEFGVEVDETGRAVPVESAPSMPRRRPPEAQATEFQTEVK